MMRRLSEVLADVLTDLAVDAGDGLQTEAREHEKGAAAGYGPVPQCRSAKGENAAADGAGEENGSDGNVICLATYRLGR